MKKTAKTIFAILLVVGSFSMFTACQEEVYPDLEDPTVLSKMTPDDVQGETEDEEEDQGMNPK